MMPVSTKDSSKTYYSTKYQEHYHSITGAAEEAKKKFVEPSIPIIDKKDSIIAFDICFGTGYNTAALLDYLKGKQATIYCFENDKEIIKQIKDTIAPFESYHIIQKLAEEGSYKDAHITIHLIIGDVKKTITTVTEKADIVFHDPFSPKNCPELWTEEFFSFVYNRMNKNGMLTTYSCAGCVRRALRSVGFSVHDGPSVGRRAPSTVAIKD